MSYSNQQFWNGRKASKGIKGLNFLEVIQCPAFIIEKRVITDNVLGPNHSCWKRAVLCTIRCLPVPWVSTHYMPIAPCISLSCDDKKCLQTLPNVPWET